MSNGKGIAKIHPPIEDKWSSFGCDAKLIKAKFYDQKEINIEELKKEAEKEGLFNIDDALSHLTKNGEYYCPTKETLKKV